MSIKDDVISLLQKIGQYFPKPVRTFIGSFIRRGTTEVELGDGAKFRFDRSDGYYWAYVKDPKGYEPEVGKVLEMFADKKTLFIDCGANKGYWGCRVAPLIGKSEWVIEVEPNKKLLPDLRKNQEINGNKFIILEFAVSDVAGQKLKFGICESHSAGGLLKGLHDKKNVIEEIEVETTTIDKIVYDALSKIPAGEHPHRIIVKLDVEGAEVAALNGAKEMLSGRDFLIIFEDHGNDPESKNTGEFLATFKLRVYHYDHVAGKAIEVLKPEDLGPIKQVPTKGYNFFACRPDSGFDMQFQRLSGRRDHVEDHGVSPSQRTIDIRDRGQGPDTGDIKRQ